MRGRWIGLLLGIVVGAGCGGARVQTRDEASPAAGVEAWNKAVRDNDPRAAYGLLSDSVKQEISFESFEARWKESQQEIQRQAEALHAVMEENPHMGEHGKLILSDGKSTGLVHEQAGWRLDAPLLSSARAATPQDALKLFVTAVEQHSFEGALKLLTSTRREGLDSVLDDFVSSLKTSIDTVATNGDHAVLHWKDGKRRWKIVLIKEDGEWRIDDFTIEH